MYYLYPLNSSKLTKLDSILTGLDSAILNFFMKREKGKKKNATLFPRMAFRYLESEFCGNRGTTQVL